METLDRSSPFHTQGIGCKDSARSHYLGGRQLTTAGKPRFEGNTTHRDAYVTHPLPGRLGPQAAPPRPVVPFDGTSTYATTFKQHPLEPRAPQQCLPPPKQAVPFDGATTYASNFPGHQPAPRAPCAPPPARPNIKFEGTSSYQQDFYAKQAEARPQEALSMAPRPHVPFEGASMSATTFVRHELPPRPPPVAPSARPNVPFSGTTTSRETYVCHQLEPPARHAPAALAKPAVPFMGTSTMKDEFKQWPMEPRPAPAAPLPRPHMPFNATTTARDTFQGQQLPPRFPGLGLELVGDKFFGLIPRGASLPCTARQVFSTVNDGQRDICILIYQGDNAVASKNDLVGQFDLGELPPSPARTLQIEVTFHVDQDWMMSASARDMHTGRDYHWLQGGRAMGQTINQQTAGGATDGTLPVYPSAARGLTC